METEYLLETRDARWTSGCWLTEAAFASHGAALDEMQRMDNTYDSYRIVERKFTETVVNRKNARKKYGQD